MEKGNKLVTGLVAGAAVGAIAGLLLAPKTGKETRSIVSTRADKIRHKTGHYVGGLRNRVSRGEGVKESSNHYSSNTE